MSEQQHIELVKNAGITDQDYQANLEWVEKSYKAAMTGRAVPCRGCESIFPLFKLFRCYHCGSYFCPNCSKEHFGERNGRIEIAKGFKVKGKTPLDELALGIDDRNAKILSQCEENEIRISAILHLASVLGSDEMEMSFHELIDEFVDHLFSKADHHESILPLIPKIPDDEDDQGFFKDCLQEHLLKEGLFGFAILVTTPVYDENDISSGWGYCRSQWFYAETYEWAFDKAMEWAKKEER